MLEPLINGITRGAIYALIALGYTMVYGILGMINFAHGEVYMIGMFVGILTLGVCASLGAMPVGVALVLAFFVAMFFAAAQGYTNERVAYRPLRRASRLAPLISAVGVSIFLQNFVMNAQSKDIVNFPRQYSAPLVAPAFALGGAQATWLQLFIVGLSVALMVGLYLFVQRTRLGKAMRACSQDQTMAGLSGIPVDRVISATFLIGSSLAAAAGILFAMYNTVGKFDAGYVAGLRAFTAAVLGGIGNIPGAMLGGFVIGLTEDATAYFWGGDWKDIAAFGALMIILIFRPRGLLGERVAEKV
jgi:branched-chain amino acid transport system permease protein